MYPESKMSTNIPTTGSFTLTVRTSYILFYFTLIYIPATAYRRKTTMSFDLKKPVRTTKRKPKKPKKPKKSSDEYEYKEDKDGDTDEKSGSDSEADLDRDDYNTDKDDAGWFDDLKMDPRFNDDPNMFVTTGTPIDLRTQYKERWSPSTESTTVVTTEMTSTTLMDLSVIGFNETWCTNINKLEAKKLESEAFIDAVKKLCSADHAEDNGVRLALRHTFESRKLIDRLMDDITARLSGNDEEKKQKLLIPKHKVNTQNEFCFARAMKSFKYFCFDADQNPYMQRYLKIISNACRLPGVEVSDIREQLVDACDNINNDLVDVL